MEKLLQNLRKPVFRSILLSYVLVCLVILAITGAGYVNNYYTLRETAQKYGEQQAHTVAAQVDNQFVTILKMLELMASKTILNEFADYTDREISVKVSRTLALEEEFGKSLTMNTCSDLIIYFDKSESVIGTNSRRFNTQLMDLFYMENNISAGEFQNIINFKGLSSSYTFGDGKVWVMRSVFNKRMQRVAVLIAVANLEDMVNYAPEVFGDDKLLLLSSGNQIIYSSQEDAVDKLLLPETKNGSISREISGQDYYIVFRRLDALGWSCAIGITESTLYSGLQIFWYIIILECLGAVILTVIVSLRQTQKAYEPVRQLMNILHNGDNSRFHETYDSLIRGLENLKEENSSLAHGEMRRNLQLNEEKIRHILEGSMTDAALIRPILGQWMHIGPEDCWFMVLIHICDEASTLFKYNQYEDSMEDSSGLKTFVLKNVVDELILNRYPGNLVMYKDNHVLFIRAEADELPDIEAKLKNLMEFYQTALNLKMAVVLGNCMSGFELISQSCSVLEEELRYDMFWMGESVCGTVLQIRSSTAPVKRVDLGSYLEASRRLINFLEIGDYKESYATLDYMLKNTFPRERKYLNYNIYRMYGLISILSTTLDVRCDENDKRFLEQLNYEERLYNVKTVNQLMTVSKELFEAIISYNEDKEKNKAPAWFNGVLNYIHANYDDVNLTVASIADNFHLSVPHLSRTFRSAMNSGVLEYIQKLRVTKARELLDKGVNVQDTAEMVGYVEAKALRRAFKRYEGINPGQYRRDMKKDLTNVETP